MQKIEKKHQKSREKKTKKSQQNKKPNVFCFQKTTKKYQAPIQTPSHHHSPIYLCQKIRSIQNSLKCFIIDVTGDIPNESDARVVSFLFQFAFAIKVPVGDHRDNDDSN